MPRKYDSSSTKAVGEWISCATSFAADASRSELVERNSFASPGIFYSDTGTENSAQRRAGNDHDDTGDDMLSRLPALLHSKA